MAEKPQPGMSFQIIGGPRLEISQTAFLQMSDRQRLDARTLLHRQGQAMRDAALAERETCILARLRTTQREDDR